MHFILLPDIAARTLPFNAAVLVKAQALMLTSAPLRADTSVAHFPSGTCKSHLLACMNEVAVILSVSVRLQHLDASPLRTQVHNSSSLCGEGTPDGEGLIHSQMCTAALRILDVHVGKPQTGAAGALFDDAALFLHSVTALQGSGSPHIPFYLQRDGTEEAGR